jgi:hypothetical protein
MADEKEPMEADGTHSRVGAELAEERDPPSSGRPDMDENRGQSGGSAYPNPHNDPKNADAENTFLGHGGESDIGGMGDGDSGPNEDER